MNLFGCKGCEAYKAENARLWRLVESAHLTRIPTRDDAPQPSSEPPRTSAGPAWEQYPVMRNPMQETEAPAPTHTGFEGWAGLEEGRDDA